MKKLALLVCVLMLAGLALSGCTAGPTPTATLRFGTGSLDGKFNPILCDNTYDQYVCSMVFDGLIGNDPKGNPTTDFLASEYKVSDDHLTYTFKIRSNAKFTNGDPVTAKDVKFTFETMCNKAYDGPFTYVVSNIVGYKEFNEGTATELTGVKAISDKEVSITVTEPYAGEIYNLGIGILSAKYYAFTTWDEFKAKNAAPMGCGQFTFKDYTPGQACNLVLTKDYYGKKPNLAGVSILIIPDETQIQALVSGQVDVINPSANKDNWDQMSADSAVSYAKRFVGNGYNVLGMDLKNPIFADKKVRQALLYGLNLKEFIDNEWQGFAQQCLTPISPVSWAYPDTSELNTYAYDPEKAKQMLDEAGWKVGADGIREKDGTKLSFTWIAYNDVAWPQHLQALAAEQWKAIGVEMKSELMDFNTVADRVFTQGKFEMFNIGWSLSIDPDPVGMYDKASDVPGGYNAMHYFNADAEKIFADARLEFDQTKRAALYKQWAKIANDDLPYLFCAVREEVWGISAKFQGFDKMGPYYNWVQCLTDVTTK